MFTNGRPEDARRSGRMSCHTVKKKKSEVGPTHDLIPPPHTDPPHHHHHSFLFHPPPSVTSPSVGAVARAMAREAPARAAPARGRRAAGGGGSPLPDGDVTLSRWRAMEGGAAPARPPLPCTRGESCRAGQGQARRRVGLRHFILITFLTFNITSTYLFAHNPYSTNRD
jgi:hypothetical protein